MSCQGMDGFYLQRRMAWLAVELVEGLGGLCGILFGEVEVIVFVDLLYFDRSSHSQSGQVLI